MADITDKEMEIQLALGTLSPMKLFLKFLSMQNEDGVKTNDWNDERTPKITTEWAIGKPYDNNEIHIELNDGVVFVFNSKEEFVGTYNYKG